MKRACPHCRGTMDKHEVDCPKYVVPPFREPLVEVVAKALNAVMYAPEDKIAVGPLDREAARAALDAIKASGYILCKDGSEDQPSPEKGSTTP